MAHAIILPQSPSPPAPASSRLAPLAWAVCAGAPPAPPPAPRLPRPASKTSSLFGVVQEGNKVDRIRGEDFWEFRVLDIDETVGYMRDAVVRHEMAWTGTYFHLDYQRHIVYLDPDIREGESHATACRRAFSELLHKNRGRFDRSFGTWLARPASRREFHPIHATPGDHQDLSIPLPARGLFGVVTIGVHLNVYTVRPGTEQVDRIWVSQRAVGEAVCYSGMLDQIVAGGMDPTDRVAGLLAPAFTLKREALEEAGLSIDLETRAVTTVTTPGRRGLVVGSIDDAPRALTFYDCKGRDAGRASEGHLEPGVRFVYDLRLDDPNFQPRKAEKGIEKFEALTVDEVKRRLRERRWKPNCGLVMLDFLVRKKLVTEVEDERFTDITDGLRRPLPFKFVQDGFPYLLPWV